VKRYLVISFIALAAALGTFLYMTDGFSYLGHNPTSCANCHVMDSAYENWYHGGHGPSILCSECHAPHGNIIVYYFVKTKLGVRDVYSFSTGQIPTLIRATDATKRDVQANCIRCHAETVKDVMAGPQPYDRLCWDCHRATSHGERGLSLFPRQNK